MVLKKIAVIENDRNLFYSVVMITLQLSLSCCAT